LGWYVVGVDVGLGNKIPTSSAVDEGERWIIIEVSRYTNEWSGGSDEGIETRSKREDGIRWLGWYRFGLLLTGELRFTRQS
jgi:hypothetical protein